MHEVANLVHFYFNCRDDETVIPSYTVKCMLVIVLWLEALNNSLQFNSETDLKQFIHFTEKFIIEEISYTIV